MPRRPTNADLVEGRLRIYEKGLPLTLSEIELRQSFRDRVVRPAFKRIGQLIEQTTPVKARQQISLKLYIAGRPSGMAAGDMIALRYVMTAALCLSGVAFWTLMGNTFALGSSAAGVAVVGMSAPLS